MLMEKLRDYEERKWKLNEIMKISNQKKELKENGNKEKNEEIRNGMVEIE